VREFLICNPHGALLFGFTKREDNFFPTMMWMGEYGGGRVASDFYTSTTTQLAPSSLVVAALVKDLYFYYWHFEASHLST
jgi:hypothetical protein